MMDNMREYSVQHDLIISRNPGDLRRYPSIASSDFTMHLRSLLLLCLCTFPLVVACQTNTDVKTDPPAKTQQPLVKKKMPKTTQAKTTTTPGALVPFTPLNKYGGRIGLSAKTQAITDQATYEAFVKTLPKNRISKRRGVPSDDALLKLPAIDFTKNMLLIGVCSSFYCKVSFKGQRTDGTTMTVVVNTPPEPKENHMLQRPVGMNGSEAYGNYAGIVVPRFEGTVKFEIKR